MVFYFTRVHLLHETDTIWSRGILDWKYEWLVKVNGRIGIRLSRCRTLTVVFTVIPGKSKRYESHSNSSNLYFVLKNSEVEECVWLCDLIVNLNVCLLNGEQIWQILIRIGVEVRNNTNGKLPYPYKPQGLISIEQIDWDGKKDCFKKWTFW